MKVKKLLSNMIAVIMVLSVFHVPQIAYAGTAPCLTSTEEAFGIKGSVDVNIKNKVKGSKYVWKTSNSKIATVDKMGVIKGIKSGDVTVTCTITTPDGKTYELSCDVAINSKTKVTVVNQEQLEKALADKAVNQIIIKTAKGKEFNIPKGDYSGKRLYLKAPFAEINNEGKFSSVHTYVSNQEQLEKALEDETITIISIVTDEEESFEIKGNYPAIRVIIDAPKSKVLNNAILRGVDVKEVKDVEKIEYIAEEAKEEVEEEVQEETPENNNPSIPTIPSFPTIPTTPTVPTTPSPTPTVPATPTPEPDDEEGETPTTPTEPTLPELNQAKNDAKAEILSAALVKKAYMIHSAWLQYYEGTIIPNMNFIDTRTTLGDVSSNKNAIINTINAYEVGSTEYYTNIILPNSYSEENGSPVYTSEQLSNIPGSTLENGRYEFVFDGRNYSVDADGEYINNITVANARVTAVSGSALSVQIIAWNNVSSMDEIIGVVNYYWDEHGDLIEIPIVNTEEFTYYTITNESIVFETALIDELYLSGPGEYGFIIKTHVGYLNVNTGTVIDITVPEE